ncbi:recombinase family protein [Rossellomorea sp. NS-SX7]|uniref:recombinase family protein n=1 Tax=Rossellomorea sp. NS-SX7 TaxID=3463856 RepID=UPI0040587A43
MKDHITASYVRVSSTKVSQKESPEHQRMLCEEKAIKEGFEITYTYEDRSSGTSINGRKDIKKMLEDAKKGMFNTLLFASISRFSRDQLDAITLKRTLVDALGIRLISIEENYDSAVDKDELKFTLFAIMAQQQAEQISLSSRRGKRQSARKGNFTGSIAPFGYHKVVIEGKKTLIPNEYAEIVKKIFHLYINENMGEQKIRLYLNKKGIPSPRNGLWGVTSVQRILQNEAYTGRNVYNKYEVKKVYDDLKNMSDRKKRQVQKEKEEWNRNDEKNWEAIIDDDIYEEAQRLRLIRGGGKRGGPRQRVNVFGGFVFCGHCGSSMVSMKSKNGKNTKDGREYRHLVCSRRRRLGENGCDNKKYIPYYDFRDAVINEVSERLKKQIDIEKEINEHMSKQQPIKNSGSISKEKTKHEKNIDINRKLLFELRKQKMLDGNIDKEQYQFEKEQYEKEIHTSQQRIKELETKIEKQENKEEFHKEIRLALEELSNLSFENFEELHITLKKLIEKLVVFSDKRIEIYTVLDNE